MVKRVMMTLGSLFKGSVSPKNLGGIITIFDQSKKHAEFFGLMRWLLFLAMVSINLAVLNILPIPVLDGGWLMFLLIEKITGRPPSQRVIGVAQWAGLILVLGLMVFVTWNDIARLIRAN
jgi:regulator of sigma E protease